MGNFFVMKSFCKAKKQADGFLLQAKSE